VKAYTYTPRVAFAAICALLLASAPLASAQEEDDEPRRSVIFFIGDGMGSSQISLGRLAAKESKQPYNLDRFKVTGLVNTHSNDMHVTDSAASATALATGVKTDNWMIGQDPEGRRLETILEVAHREGYATGLVTTTRITHATPAAFAAHVKHRGMERDIAAQLVEKGYPEVLIGGGSQNFSEDQLAALRKQGYRVELALETTTRDLGDKLALFASKSHLPYVVDGGGTDLRRLTELAVSILSAQGPFFLMVEGGRIDHAAHAHDAASMIRDQLDFDRAVGWALDSAGENADLLIVVTADHATGNLGISEVVDLPALLKVKASSERLIHEQEVDPTNAESRKDFVNRVEAAYGFELTSAEVDRVFARPKDRYYAPLALGHVASDHFGVFFFDVDIQQDRLGKTHGHDGAMVPVFAFGPGASAFSGTLDNTEIPKRIAKILKLPAPGGLALPASAPKEQAQKKEGWF